jgi:hypothetical protein
LAGVEHSDTVPVNASSVVRKIVLDVNNDGVTPFGSHNWAWVLAIDEHHWPITTASIRVRLGDIRNFKVVLQSCQHIAKRIN